ncbi:MAG: hypothetical protein ABIS67_04745 [Candidatus Eisenbacteria bacterium]
MAPGVVLLAAVLSGACGKPQARVVPEPATPLPLRIEADTGRTHALAVPSPEQARAWFGGASRMAPARVTPPLNLELPRAQAPPEAPPVEWGAPESLVRDEGLRPPVPMGPAVLRLPPPRGRTMRVDLDVRVDETGAVSDALWAGGSTDSIAVRAATECALAMRFHPALQSGRAVAVWCRQRFEFGGGGVQPF